ncbi:MAG: hypothetical protein K6E78_03065 [Treponema sp.]|nr:hypothetical protein [Treponema sp.]
MEKIKLFFVGSVLLLVFIACKQTVSSEQEPPVTHPLESLEIKTTEEETLCLENVKGKSIYAIFTNPNKAEIQKENIRVIKKINGINEVLNGTQLLENAEKQRYCQNHTDRIFYKSVKSVKNASYIAARAAADSSFTKPEKITNPVENETVKKIYVDNDLSMQTYRNKKSTLRAIGQYCYVWIVDDYYTDELAETAKALAQKFDELYLAERNLFGPESESIFYGDQVYSTMEEWSATDSKVNIVLYDIGCDYYSLYSKGVMGYFYDKDYFLPEKKGDLRYSNQGKYFYIDSYYAKKNPDKILSTLAHEFQHMIDFGLLRDEDEETWFKEFLALSAEDALFDFLGIPLEESPRYRLSSFNAHYIFSGLEYNTSQGSLSYSVLYAFSAWCSRNFGGTDFIKAVATSKSANENAIVYAVNQNAKTNYSFEELFRLYTLSLISEKADFSLNKDDFSSSMYPLSAINLNDDFYNWSSEVLNSDLIQNSQSEEKLYKGPALFSWNFIPDSLRPNGFVLYKLGTAQNDKIEVVISKGSSSQKVYLYAN